MRVTPRLLDGMTTELERPFIELRPGSEMAKSVKALAAKPSDLSSISEHTRWRARTNCHQLSSDLLACAVVCTCSHI